MLRAFFGPSRRELKLSERSNRYLAVRSSHPRATLMADGEPGGHLSGDVQQLLRNFDLVADFAKAGVQVLGVRRAKAPTLAGQAIRALRTQAQIRFAGSVLTGMKSGLPATYTENLFLRLREDQPGMVCRSLLSGWMVRQPLELEYQRNLFFVRLPEGTGRAVFGLATSLLKDPRVLACHPEIVWPLSHRQASGARQWHLAARIVNGLVPAGHANVEAAWAESRGLGVTIAVIDTGIDMGHPEFAGAGKVVKPWDVDLLTGDSSGGSGYHGTAAAGVACASGEGGIFGVAPEAALMPIRLGSGVGSKREADAIYYAAKEGADVISVSWGPKDGNWQNPADPLHGQDYHLPEATRSALEWATVYGRGGKGVPVFWAAGNGNEPMDLDGYASSEYVMAIGANGPDGGRAPYSDHGKRLFACFPSGSTWRGGELGIWSTDRRGDAGYNPGLVARGDAAGHYLNNFGGTSAAAPGAAGIAALVLAVRPDLSLASVRRVLAESCVRSPGAIGLRDDGEGYGRLDAARAVALAKALS